MLFPAWETFYVIVGSAAGALTGLMFVVIALVADFRGSAQQVDAFGTPTVVHFGAVLLLSCLVTAPWPAVRAASGALGSFGAVGTIYMAIVFRRARAQADYEPVLEDWLFHFALPIAAYAGILASSAALPRRSVVPLFVIGAAALLLLFVGIHNAWDTVTYIIIRRWDERDRRGEPAARDVDAASGTASSGAAPPENVA